MEILVATLNVSEKEEQPDFKVTMNGGRYKLKRCLYGAYITVFRSNSLELIINSLKRKLQGLLRRLDKKDLKPEFRGDKTEIQGRLDNFFKV